MDVQLVVAQGNRAGQIIPIKTPKFFIGRAEDCHLKPRSELVSRHHCVILVEDDYVAIRDFGSKNGTFVNGEQVYSEKQLGSGDLIAVGQLEFELQLNVAVGGEKKPKVNSVQEAAERAVETATTQTESGEEEGMDLGDWLEGGQTNAADEETRTLEVGRYVPSPDTSETAAASEETVTPDNRDDEEKKREDKGHKKPGKVPAGLKAANQGNSQDAAASALRNFFRGR